MTSLTRRDLLKRGAALLGTVAAGTAAVAVAGPIRSVPPLTRIRAAGVHLDRSVRSPGDSGVVTGRLIDDAGSEIGSFHSTATVFAATGNVGARAASRLESHVFVLPGGSIFGLGAAGHDPDTADPFTIVGGTGVFAGARGTYTARQGIREFGGDGSAEFILTMLEA